MPFLQLAAILGVLCVIFGSETYALPANRVDFLVLGPQYSATEAISHLIAGHPKVKLPKKRVLKPRPGGLGFVDLLESCNASSLPEYYTRFRDVSHADGEVLGDVGVNLLSCSCCPEFLSQHMVGLKLIILLREPVSRTVIHFSQLKKSRAKELGETNYGTFAVQQLQELENCLERSSTDDAMTHCYFDNPSFGWSTYDRMIQYWQKWFAANRMLVLYTEDLQKDPLDTLRLVEKFLEIPKVEEYPETLLHRHQIRKFCHGNSVVGEEHCASYNASSYKHPMPADLLQNRRSASPVQLKQVVKFATQLQRRFAKLSSRLHVPPPPGEWVDVIKALRVQVVQPEVSNAASQPELASETKTRRVRKRLARRKQKQKQVASVTGLQVVG